VKLNLLILGRVMLMLLRCTLVVLLWVVVMVVCRRGRVGRERQGRNTVADGPPLMMVLGVEMGC
jgi:hypothetical protein